MSVSSTDTEGVASKDCVLLTPPSVAVCDDVRVEVMAAAFAAVSVPAGVDDCELVLVEASEEVGVRNSDCVELTAPLRVDDVVLVDRSSEFVKVLEDVIASDLVFSSEEVCALVKVCVCVGITTVWQRVPVNPSVQLQTQLG